MLFFHWVVVIARCHSGSIALLVTAWVVLPSLLYGMTAHEEVLVPILPAHLIIAVFSLLLLAEGLIDAIHVFVMQLRPVFVCGLSSSQSGWVQGSTHTLCAGTGCSICCALMLLNSRIAQ